MMVLNSSYRSPLTFNEEVISQAERNLERLRSALRPGSSSSTSIPKEALDALNEELGQALLADGRVYVGTTLYEERVALRPAISNWRTREADINLLVEVVQELGDGLQSA